MSPKEGSVPGVSASTSLVITGTTELTYRERRITATDWSSMKWIPWLWKESLSSWSGSGTAAATLIAATGPPWLSLPITLVSAVLEIVTSATSRPLPSATPNPVSDARAARRRTLLDTSLSVSDHLMLVGPVPCRDGR